MTKTYIHLQAGSKLLPPFSVYILLVQICC
nr:MAG TPA: hypothetical protein [Bacteriophage sp.]